MSSHPYSASNLQTLGILLERAEAERDEALKAVQEAQLRAAQARDQADQLGQYRVDYQQRWTQQFARAGTMDIVGCYQNFGGKLDQAIDSQGQVAQHAEMRVERARAVLRDKEMRAAAIAKLIERRRLEIRRAAQKAEQKQSDEQSARTALAGGFHPLGRLRA